MCFSREGPRLQSMSVSNKRKLWIFWELSRILKRQETACCWPLNWDYPCTPTEVIPKHCQELVDTPGHGEEVGEAQRAQGTRGFTGLSSSEETPKFSLLSIGRHGSRSCWRGNMLLLTYKDFCRFGLMMCTGERVLGDAQGKHKATEQPLPPGLFQTLGWMRSTNRLRGILGCAPYL